MGSAWVGSLTPTLLSLSYIFAATSEGGSIPRQGCFLQQQVLVSMPAIKLNLCTHITITFRMNQLQERLDPGAQVMSSELHLPLSPQL